VGRSRERGREGSGGAKCYRGGPLLKAIVIERVQLRCQTALAGKVASGWGRRLKAAAHVLAAASLPS
jgi:hypothetical protein